MGARVIGDRVQRAPRRELDRKDFDAVRVGGVLTDARAPSRNASPAQGAVGGEGAPSSSLTVEELDADPSVSGVRKIIVPNDSLTDDGGGQVTLYFGIKVFRQGTAPGVGEIVADVVNFWYDTSDGHLYYFNENEALWIDLAGWK